MPYIPDYMRGALRSTGARPQTSGQLNYCVTMLVRDFLGKNPDYEAFNSVMGVMACVQAEMYRRLAAPYEDAAIKKNGDL